MMRNLLLDEGGLIQVKSVSFVCVCVCVCVCVIRPVLFVPADDAEPVAGRGRPHPGRERLDARRHVRQVPTAVGGLP